MVAVTAITITTTTDAASETNESPRGCEPAGVLHWGARAADGGRAGDGRPAPTLGRRPLSNPGNAPPPPAARDPARPARARSCRGRRAPRVRLAGRDRRVSVRPPQQPHLCARAPRRLGFAVDRSRHGRLGREREREPRAIARAPDRTGRHGERRGRRRGERRGARHDRAPARGGARRAGPELAPARRHRAPDRAPNGCHLGTRAVRPRGGGDRLRRAEGAHARSRPGRSRFRRRVAAVDVPP